MVVDIDYKGVQLITVSDVEDYIDRSESELHRLRDELAQCQAAFQVVKDACDRDWTTETPREIAAIASNAIFWRDEEIRQLKAALANLGKPVTGKWHNQSL